MQEKMFSTGEAGKLLGVSYVTVARWIRAGKLRAIKLPSGHYRVPESEIKRLLEEEGVRKCPS